MAQPPLRLDNYFFTKSAVEVNEAFEPEKLEKPITNMVSDVTLDIESSKNEQNEKNYRIRLVVREVVSKEGPLPYLVDMGVTGFFTVANTFDHADLDHLVQVNGASMLYGAVREHVLGITGRFPFGPYQLPTIHLAGALPKQAK